jgi:PAS domain S-box-containing protein
MSSISALGPGTPPEAPAQTSAAISASDVFRNLVENSPFGIYAVDADFRLALISAGAQKVFKTLNPAIGRAFDEVLRYLWPEPFASDAIGRFRHTLESGEPYQAPSMVESRHDIAEVEAYDWKIERVCMPDGRLGVVCHFYDLTERLRFETEMRETEARYKLALRAGRMGSWESDFVAGTRTWSPEGMALFGLELPGGRGCIGGEHDEYEHALFPADRHLVRRFHALVDSVDSFAAEYRIVHGDGRVLWLAGRGQVVSRQPDGRAHKLVSIMADISERKRDEEALLRSEALHRIAFDAAPLGMVYVAPEGRILKANDAFCALTGYSAAELESLPSIRLFHPEDLPAERERLRAFLEGRSELYQNETRYLRKDGSVCWVRGTARMLHDAEGKAIHSVGVFQDITSEREAAQALLARTTELEMLMREAPVAIFVCHDTEGRRMTGNAAAHRLLRMEKGANLSIASAEGAYSMHRDGRPLEAADLPLQRAASSGQPAPYTEFDIIFPEGDRRTIFGGAQPLLDDEGRPRGSLGTFVDITEHKRMEAALRDTDRRKDEFLATLAHELRNPLAPIRNSLHLLHLAEKGSDAAERSKVVMERQLEHMVRLIDDLMDISRITSGKLELRKATVTLDTVVRNAVEAARPALDEVGHVLDVHLPREQVWIDADLTRLSQAFSNLLNNAAKYTDRGGDLRLAALLDGDAVVVTVSDNGIGIPAGQLPRIFDMFAQVDLSLHRARGGLGIGLSLVKRLVEMHGGSVEAQSAGEGRGSAFTVRLPTVAAPHRDGPERWHGDAAAPVSTAMRILIVDDNRDGADSLAAVLALSGHDVRTAYDGSEGVRVAEAFEPHVMLLDIGLPGLDGYELCRRIRGRAWATHAILIAVTGWGATEDRRRSSAAGFDLHMVKPVDPQTLVDRIDQLASGSPLR